eukprot:1793249-Rhodomonas_salina.1
MIQHAALQVVVGTYRTHTLSTPSYNFLRCSRNSYQAAPAPLRDDHSAAVFAPSSQRSAPRN